MHPDLAHIESWIFDLDNSLYPHDCNLFELIDLRMGEYIQRLLGVDAVEARRVQKEHFHAHGTTLAGLMASHGVEPGEFLDFVHDVDLARVTADPALVVALDALPGRKFVFTNASEAYARRVLERLGLANAFDGMHDIHAMAYIPKPDPSGYRAICDLHGIDPRRALFADDMVRNLKPAKAIGMTTLWVDNGSEQGPDPAEMAYVDHRTGDIAGWLGALLGENVA
ncbi:MAG TPA: pyrimidine 5'-nucleotidase [Allosphingosinicella sp.]|jgi:putative hydrolase of the HAD superfamily|nr:pyrimidine 5'-nucleotidase [Allosphingosinicella sp.]